MDFSYSEEHELILHPIKEFVSKEVSLFSEPEKEETEKLSSLLITANELGLFSLTSFPSDEGLEVPQQTYSSILQEISTECPSLAFTVLSHGYCASFLHAAGSEKTASHLSQLLNGEQSFAWGSAFSPTSVKVPSLKDDNGRTIIDGKIPNLLLGNTKQKLLGFAQTEDARLQPFVFSLDAPGLSFREEKGFLGLRGLTFGTVEFEKYAITTKMEAVSQENFHLFLDKQQLLAGNLLNGVAASALKFALDYAKERKQFGKPIAAFQAIQWKLADMAMNLRACEALLLDSLSRKGDSRLTKACFNKIAENAVKSTQEAIQIFGGYGFTREFPVERLYRDATTIRAIFA